MRQALGLVGFPLAHSFSPSWFANRFVQAGLQGWTYDLFPLTQISDLPRLLQDRHDLRGFNVTIPYKQAILPFLDELDARARLIGAVNTVDIQDDGSLVGYNTDVPAFTRSLQSMIGPGFSGQALILGSGGAAHAVRTVLDELAISYMVVSRTAGPGRLTYDSLRPEDVGAHQLVINTTPLGMHPNEDTCPPIPYQALGPSHLIYDLVYNPAETLLLKKAKKQGATGINGLEMLYLQAEYSWQIWTRK